MPSRSEDAAPGRGFDGAPSGPQSPGAIPTPTRAAEGGRELARLPPSQGDPGGGDEQEARRRSVSEGRQGPDRRGADEAREESAAAKLTQGRVPEVVVDEDHVGAVLGEVSMRLEDRSSGTVRAAALQQDAEPERS